MNVTVFAAREQDRPQAAALAKRLDAELTVNEVDALQAPLALRIGGEGAIPYPCSASRIPASILLIL